MGNVEIVSTDKLGRFFWQTVTEPVLETVIGFVDHNVLGAVLDALAIG